MSGDTSTERFSVRDRVAIVTGASSGLGERFTRALADAGAHVVAAARRFDRLQALAQQLPGVVPVRSDVCVDADRVSLVNDTVERFGRVDILVNNAGGGTGRPAVDETADDLRASLELNLVAVFELAKLVAEHMAATGTGSIVNIASVFGSVSSWPIPNAAYAASKGAVVNLTRELGCQWASRGVRVNAIAPGFFPSEMMQPMIDDERMTAFMRRNCPMRRYGEPHELDGALIFLASDASSFCTGQVLTVDGGWSVH